MDTEVTELTVDNVVAAAPPVTAPAVAAEAVVSAPAGDVPAALAPFPSSDALRDYGQRLSDALWARAQALSAPAGRRAMLPVAVAAVAALLVARDVLFGGAAGP